MGIELAILAKFLPLILGGTAAALKLALGDAPDAEQSGKVLRAALEAVAGVLPNWANERLERLADRLRLTDDDRRRGFGNADLHRLVGAAIAAAFEESSRERPATDRAFAEAQSRLFRDEWGKPGEREMPARVKDALLETRFVGDAEGLKSQPVLDPQLWRLTLDAVMGATKIREHDQARERAAAHLTAHYTGILWELSKRAWRDNDLAWPALMMRLLSGIAGDVKGTRDDVAQLRIDLEHATRLIVQLAERAAPHAPAEQRELLVEIRANQGVILATLGRIEGKVDHVAGEVEQLGAKTDHGIRVGEQTLAGVKRLEDRLADSSAAPRVAAPTHNLTSEHTVRHHGFVGRAVELKELHRRLTAAREADDVRAEAIVHAVPGEGGIGKTRVALAYLIEGPKMFDGAYPWKGRWWIDGSRVRLDQSCRELADTLGLGLPENTPSEVVRAKLVDRLQHGGPHVVVIDNAEAGGGAGGGASGGVGESHGGAVPDWSAYEQLALASPSRVLITTRDRAGLDGFAEVYQIDVLSMPDALTLLRAARASFMNGSMDEQLRRLADEVGRFGVALSMCAAWLREWPMRTPAQLLEALRRAETEGPDPLEDEKLGAQASKYGKSARTALWVQVEDLVDTGAMDLLIAAAFCDADRIPVSLLGQAAGLDEQATDEGLKTLHDRCVVTLSPPGEGETEAMFRGGVSLHRVMQKVVRRWVWKEERRARAVRVVEGVCEGLEGVLHGVAHHRTFAARVRVAPHAEALLEAMEGRLRDLPLPAQLAGFDQLNVVTLCRWLGMHYDTHGEHGAAVRHLNACVNWGLHQGQAAESFTAVWLDARARSLANLGKAEEALLDIRRSIEWFEQHSPWKHGSVALRYATRAAILLDLGDADGALLDIGRSIEWGEWQSRPDERSLAIDYATRAEIRRVLGDAPGALLDIGRSIEWGERQSARDGRDLAIWYATRAEIRRDLRRCDEATRDIDAALAWYRANLPQDARSIGAMEKTKASIDAARRRGDGGNDGGAGVAN
ncbi:MAG: hypothetical protein ACKVZJ_05065 [Phycisphaerales bacterium]